MTASHVHLGLTERLRSRTTILHIAIAVSAACLTIGAATATAGVAQTNSTRSDQTKLKSGKGPVQVPVIDHAQMPSEN